MFEALFILTTIDTGTRIARFLLQETLGKIYKPFDRTDWLPGALLATGLVTAGWGVLVWTGSIDTIWPMFGIANQLLAVIALVRGHNAADQHRPRPLCPGHAAADAVRHGDHDHGRLSTGYRPFHEHVGRRPKDGQSRIGGQRGAEHLLYGLHCRLGGRDPHFSPHPLAGLATRQPIAQARRTRRVAARGSPARDSFVEGTNGKMDAAIAARSRCPGLLAPSGRVRQSRALCSGGGLPLLLR